MKKKLGFVLSIIMVICTLSISLVACAPKDPDPFTAVDKQAALEEVWDMWAAQNINVTGDTLGLDVKLNLKDASTNLDIALLGGVTQNTDEASKEGFRLSITDNKKEGTDKNVIDLILSKSAIYVAVDGLSDKPIKIDGINIPNIGAILPIAPSDLAATLKGVLVPIINQSVDSVTIDPVKNGKKVYDVKYTFDININKVVDAIVTLVSEITEISEDVDEIITQVKDTIGNLELSITANTVDNTQTKVKKPAKGAPKYSYAGGKLTNLEINATKDGDTMAVSNSIKMQSTIPTITAPTDVIEIENILFPSSINGAFVMKDREGAVVSTYNYTVNIDFTVDQLIGTIIDCVSEQNAMPLLNKMFKDGEGKIFVEVSHECGATCKIEHISKESRPVLTVAYDPSTFDTNRVYAAINLNGILPANLSSALSSVVDASLLGVVDDLLKTLPYEDLVFSIDPTAYMALENSKNPTPTTTNTSVAAVSDIITTNGDKIVVNFEQMFSSILNLDIIPGLKYYAQMSNGAVSIDFTKSVEDILNLDAIADVKDIVEDIVSLMFPEVATLDINAVYSNEHIDTEWNIKDKFTNEREFVYKRTIEVTDTPYNNTCETCQGTGYTAGIPMFGECANITTNPNCPDGRAHNEATHIENVNETKVVPINSEITYNKNAAGLLDITTGIELYNGDGTQNRVCYEEVMALVGSIVKGAYTDLKGNSVSDAELRILDVIGLDRNIIGKPQTIYFAVGGTLGNSWFDFARDFLNIVNLASGIIGLPDMTDIISYRFVDDVIPFEVTLTGVKDLVWSQSGDDEQKIDENKVYERGITLNTNFDFTIVYADDSEKKVENITSPDASGKFSSPSGLVNLTYGSSFTMTYTAFGAFTKTVQINMDESKYALNSIVSVKVNDEVSYRYRITNLINSSGENASVYINLTPAKNAANEFNAKYSDAVNAVVTGDKETAATLAITFKQVGTYEFVIVARTGEIVTLTYNVTAE